jgi:hypothetical protein
MSESATPSVIYPAKVSVADINMPFWSMVIFMVKWAIAAIPAFIILMVLFWGFVAVMVAIFAGSASTLLHAH